MLLLHLALAAAFSVTIPLGEAPDEPAHLSYARFIAQHGRLPATLAEREAAGYRSAWPSLYHTLAAGPLAAVGDAPPTRLKAVGDTPRRLIPTNGQTIAAYLHTTDEAWPWRGLPLAWHLSRFISVGLSTLAVAVTYAVAWQVTRRRGLALSAAALHATLPQALFTGSVVSDDTLLVLLSGLILLTMVAATRQAARPGVGRFLGLGALLGLATVAKYNALPLWAIVAGWTAWLTLRRRKPSDSRVLGLAIRLGAILAGAALTGGWWFAFVWQQFNQVDTQGWLAGSLAALTAGTSDASLQQLGRGVPAAVPTAAQWTAWGITLFKSFWGLFGGGGTIEWPGPVYGLPALLCLPALLPLPAKLFARRPASPYPLLLTAYFLFFLPLPVFRFALSGALVETAQGRHLFPALPAIATALVWGMSRYQGAGNKTAKFQSKKNARALLHAGARLRCNLQPATCYLLPALCALLSLYSLFLIKAAYPPPIPLTTTGQPGPLDHRLNAPLTPAVTLVGLSLGNVADGLLPVTLVWQAEAPPPEDYLISLTLTNAAGQPIGDWLGQPLGGRYPSRAWDEGDMLRETIPVAVVPGTPAGAANLTLTLLTPAQQPASAPVNLAANLPLPAAPARSHLPAHLRPDGLPPDAPFTYRGTLSVALPHPAAPALTPPSGQIFAPDAVISGPAGSLAHFIVKANWPAGRYQLAAGREQWAVDIENRPRQFLPSPFEQGVQANFANKITLLGYDLPQRRVQPGQSFPLTLHWRAQETLGVNLVVFNHLLDTQAVQRGGADRIPRQYYTTLLWVPDEIVSDNYDVPVEANAPPGVYWLHVGLYPSDQPALSLPLVENGRLIDRTSVRLGPVKVGGPPPSVTVNQAAPQTPLSVDFGGQITLLGFDLTDAAGNAVHNSEISLYWRANAGLSADYTVFVHFLNPQGEVVAQADGPPANGAYPSSLWDTDEIIVDHRALPALPPGAYSLWVGLYRPDTGERLPAAGRPDGAVKLLDFERGN